MEANTATSSRNTTLTDNTQQSPDSSENCASTSGGSNTSSVNSLPLDSYSLSSRLEKEAKEASRRAEEVSQTYRLAKQNFVAPAKPPVEFFDTCTDRW